MINALVTGSHKYGDPHIASDIDVVVMVDADTKAMLWKRSQEEHRAFFDRVQFQICNADPAHVMFVEHRDEPYVVVACGMSEEDERLLGGLHKWVRVDDKPGSFRSTHTNTSVNLVPVTDVSIWDIWEDGTRELARMKERHGLVTRQHAIDLFTILGMPRFNSQ